MSQPLEYKPKKLPKQARSRATFDAIVEACTRLLPEMGYRCTTTNHIAETAGVAISSLYEYFPDKDAIVAQVAERLIERVMRQLTNALPQVFQAPKNKAVAVWIQLIYSTLQQERDIVGVFYYEVPYTNQLKQVREITPKLFQFSEAMRSQAKIKHSKASLYLLINLVSTTILQLVLDPPEEVSLEDMLEALVFRVERWLSGK